MQLSNLKLTCNYPLSHFTLTEFDQRKNLFPGCGVEVCADEVTDEGPVTGPIHEIVVLWSKLLILPTMTTHLTKQKIWRKV